MFDEFYCLCEVKNLIKLGVNRQILYHSDQCFFLLLDEPKLALRAEFLILLEYLLAELYDTLADLHLYVGPFVFLEDLEDLRHEDVHFFAKFQRDLA